MRFPVFLIAILLLAACSKNRKITKRIEGTWKLERVLLNDGQQVYPNEIHIFAKEKSGGSDYASWTKYSTDYSDTTTGAYLVTKKGDFVILRNESVNPIQADTCLIDDMDDEMLILRSVNGVLFFYKQ